MNMDSMTCFASDNHKVGYDHNTDSSHVCFGFVQLDQMGTFEVLMWSSGISYVYIWYISVCVCVCVCVYNRSPGNVKSEFWSQFS
jgi:hypothetical protein